jgi:UPF0755 protein
MEKSVKEGKRFWRIIVFIAVIFLIPVTIRLCKIYRMVYSPNVIVTNGSYLYIPTGSDVDDVRQILQESQLLKDIRSFDWVADKKNYKNHVYPGRYKLTNRMNNNDFINILRSGSQEPVQLVFNNIRTKEQLSARVSSQIEADSADIMNLLSNKQYISRFGFNLQTVLSVFIPNTYELYWNTNATGFVERMAEEYKKFWNEERKYKAESIGLTLNEVSTLASIIDEESIWEEEKQIIAGVYLNRLRKSIRLQADPTIRFAMGDFTVRRILKNHLDVDSPYNTYKYAGLPPGPIVLPSISGIDAVLNAEEHEYLYFCAKEDLSGYHCFSKTLVQHNRYARLYQQALNQQKIWK